MSTHHQHNAQTGALRRRFANLGKRPSRKGVVPHRKTSAAPKAMPKARARPLDPVVAYRQRISDVFAGEHFKGREQAAGHLLTETDLTAEAINKVLGTIPKENADTDIGMQMLRLAREGGQPDLGDDPSDDHLKSAGNPLLEIINRLTPSAQ